MSPIAIAVPSSFLLFLLIRHPLIDIKPTIWLKPNVCARVCFQHVCRHFSPTNTHITCSEVIKASQTVVVVEGAVHQSSLCRHEVIIRTVAPSRLPTLSLMSAGSHTTKNSNLVIMNRVHSVTVFGHTSAIRPDDGKGDERLCLFPFCPRWEAAPLICFQRTLRLPLPYYYIVSGTCPADRCSPQLFTTSA